MPRLLCIPFLYRWLIWFLSSSHRQHACRLFFTVTLLTNIFKWSLKFVGFEFIDLGTGFVLLDFTNKIFIIVIWRLRVTEVLFFFNSLVIFDQISKNFWIRCILPCYGFILEFVLWLSFNFTTFQILKLLLLI